MRSPGSALIVSAIALSAAGCFSDRGVAIEVDVGTTGATSVELYVGNACGGHPEAKISCRGGIAPPMATSHLDGKIWFRDDPVPYRARVKGHKATFRIEAGEADPPTTLPIAVVVGSTGPGTPALGVATLYAVDVPAGDARIIAVQLAAPGAADPGTSNATEERAQVWAEPDPPSVSCIAVEHWVKGEMTRDFIVPPDDPDCDSVPEQVECDRAGANAVVNENGVDLPAQCYVASSDTTTDACKRGAFGCADGVGQTHDCLTTRDEVCVPKPFCECTDPNPDACVQRDADPLTGTAAIPRITCRVPVPPGDACRDRMATIDLNGPLRNARCDQPTLSTLEIMELGSGTKSHAFGGVDFELTSPQNNCIFRLQVNSGRHALLSQELGGVRVNVGGHAIVIPIVFTFFPTVSCTMGDPISCQVDEVLDDPMWGCVAP